MDENNNLNMNNDENINETTNDNFVENKEDKNNYVSSDAFKKENLSESDLLATKAAEEAIKQKKAKKTKIIRTIITIFAVLILIIVIFRIVSSVRTNSEKKQEVMKQVQTVKVMNISSELSGSGTLKPKDSYTITSLVEGEVKNVYFELGDRVRKGQLLLEIDSSSAKREIGNASSSVIQARDAYNNAKYEYEKLVRDYENRTFKAPYSGYLRTLSIKAGDTISNGTSIGTIVNATASKKTVEQSLELSRKYPFIYTTIGVHPSDCAEMDEEELKWLEEKCA